MGMFDWLLGDTKKEDAKISSDIASRKLANGVAFEKDKDKSQTKNPLANSVSNNTK